MSNNPVRGMLVSLAAMAVGMIEEDPELTERLRKYSAEHEAPFDAEGINPLFMGMVQMDLLAVGQDAMSDVNVTDTEPEPEGHSGHEHAAMVLPIPNSGEAAAESAAALGAGSFTTEYVHSVPGVLDAFNDWLTEKAPETAAAKGPVTTDELVRADKMLTFMTRAADAIARHGTRPTVRISNEELFGDSIKEAVERFEQDKSV